MCCSWPRPSLLWATGSCAPSTTPRRRQVIGVDVTGTRLENQYLRATVDPQTGHLTSLYNKFAGRESLAGPANILQAIAEQPGAHSAWTIALTNDVTPLAKPDSVEVIEQGPVRATIRSTYRYRESFFTLDVTLLDGVPRLDVRLQADWQERECCLKVAFPVAVEDGEATFEVPYGSVVRPADGAEVLAQGWLDLSNVARGVSILSNARYGCDVSGNVMRLSLLRGIPDLDPRADQGEHDVAFAVFPHRSGWRVAQTVQKAQELELPAAGAATIAPLGHDGALDDLCGVRSAAGIVQLCARRSHECAGDSAQSRRRGMGRVVAGRAAPVRIHR